MWRAQGTPLSYVCNPIQRVGSGLLGQPELRGLASVIHGIGGFWSLRFGMYGFFVLCTLGSRIYCFRGFCFLESGSYGILGVCTLGSWI